ncbi:MAG TPA: AgmX/PglI C-terminal domain-containing protein [Kofleriaceae bacterium]|nr:AgmX/PglI C-terminal domain-containing protein [Kofleriaceae bacterium]
MGRITVLMFLAACAHETSTPPEPQSSPPPPPLRVVFGTCAPETMQFIVGATARPRVTGQVGDAFLCDGQPCGVIGAGSGIGTLSGGHGTPSQGYGISYGYIGHGSGPHYASVPSVKQGALTALGELDQTIVRRYIRRNINRIRYCYEKELVTKSDLAGTLTASWTIDSGGLVRDVKLDGFPAVASCMTTALSAIEFPRPKQGSVKASTSFTFTPGEGATYARPPHDPVAPPPPENPLRTIEPALTACLHTQPDHYGTGLVEFGAQPKVIGLAQPACVEKLVAELNKTAKPMRCSFAFGEMPFAKLPTLELQASATFFNGEDRANAKQAIEQHLVETHDAPLAMQGPIAITAQPTTPMTIVRDAAVAIDDADLDVAYVAPHAFGGVRLVPALELPPAGLPKRPRADQPGPVAELTVTQADVANWNALRAKLRALRTNSAGELLLHADTLQYQDFVRVVDLAGEEGFAQWRLR